MPQYLITRKMNNREYFLEDIDRSGRAIWITKKEASFRFDHQWELEQFVKDTFPGKKYYATQYNFKDEWGMILKPTGIF